MDSGHTQVIQSSQICCDTLHLCVFYDTLPALKELPCPLVNLSFTL